MYARRIFTPLRSSIPPPAAIGTANTKLSAADTVAVLNGSKPSGSVHVASYSGAGSSVITPLSSEQ